MMAGRCKEMVVACIGVVQEVSGKDRMVSVVVEVDVEDREVIEEVEEVVEEEVVVAVDKAKRVQKDHTLTSYLFQYAIQKSCDQHTRHGEMASWPKTTTQPS